jgi:hypothetical protein
VFHVGWAQFGDNLIANLGGVCNAGVEFVIWHKTHTAPQRNTQHQVNTNADVFVIGHYSQYMNTRDQTCYNFGADGAGRQSVVTHNIVAQPFKRPNHTTVLNNTQLPIGLITYFLEHFLFNGLVLDACAGSGSCLIACLLKGTQCISIEKDPEQVQGITNYVIEC